VLRLLLKVPPIPWVRRLISQPALLNFGATYHYIRTQRICYVGGRLGGYKTSLSFAIAWKFWRDKYVESLYTNLESPWADDIEELGDFPDPRNIKAVCIFDEGGLAIVFLTLPCGVLSKFSGSMILRKRLPMITV
jgi:hypothetical protein